MKTATFSQRLMAYNLDITVFILVMFPVSFLIPEDIMVYSLAFGFICLYHAIMESSKWQATLGKRQGNMAVVDLADRPISFLLALVRILLKFLSMVLFFVGFFMIYFRKDRRGLHDLIAGTKVIVKEKAP